MSEVVMRQLKRNFTDAMWERADETARRHGCATAVHDASPRGSAGPHDVSMCPPMPQHRLPQQVPPLPNLACMVGKDRSGAMEPPLQPPPWKRPSLKVTSTPHVLSPPTSPSTPSMLGKRKPSSPPPARSAAMYQSPQRLLTPRVSWSEIISHSQEALDDRHAVTGSPRTPAFRIRRPSPPPAKAPLRRRPLSDDEEPNNTRDQNEGRFEREFCDISVIGKGQFSTVYRVRNCIDRCLYAVKKTTQISRRGLRSAQLREVFALANVSMEAEGCPNIVRYFSSWYEDGRLHIQTELCDGSLRDRMLRRHCESPQTTCFEVDEVIHVLRDVATGLGVLHGCNFVHLDIKPDNILVSRNPREQGYYKIADLGLAVAALGSGCDDVSEGDCRYLAREVLRGDLSDLPKADIFSLGLVSYELATNPIGGLPCNGEEWQALRNGVLGGSALLAFQGPVLELLQRMVHVDPRERPSARSIAEHGCITPQGSTCVDALQALHAKMREQALEAERNRRLADTYWQELLHFKRQELLGSSPGGGGGFGAPAPSTSLAQPTMGITLSVSGGGESVRSFCRARVADARLRGPRRGRTFG